MKLFDRPITTFLLCLLTAFVAACSKEDDSVSSDLLDGTLPMRLTAAVGQLHVEASTRGGEDNRTWKNGAWRGGEEVTIWLDNKSAKKRYRVAANGSLTPVTEAEQLYWTNTSHTIKARYPYAYEKVQADQTTDEGYSLSDILKAEQRADYTTSSVHLPFRHASAMVTLELLAGDTQLNRILANYTEASPTISVQFLGQDAVTKSGGAANTVTPMFLSKREEVNGDTKLTFSAMLPPKSDISEKFVAVRIGENTYYYTPSNRGNSLQANKKYTYTLTIKDRLLIEGNITSKNWTISNQTATADKVIYKLYVDAEVFSKFPADGPTFSVRDADGQTINRAGGNTEAEPRLYYPISGMEVRIQAAVAEGKILNKLTVKVVPDDSSQEAAFNRRGGYSVDGVYYYYFSDINCDLRITDFEVEQADASSIDYNNVQVGDYLYGDGAIAKECNLKPGCVGIVFLKGAANNDSYETYKVAGKPLAGDRINGYAMALTDATETVVSWGRRAQGLCLGLENPVGTFDGDRTYTNYINEKFNGFGNTRKVIADCFQTADWHYYEAFMQTITYRESVQAPLQSSDWYIPSLGQLCKLYDVYKGNNSVLKTKLKEAEEAGAREFREAPVGNGDVHQSWPARAGYWSCTETTKTGANYYDAPLLRFTGASIGMVKVNASKGQFWACDSFVRNILTF